MSMMGEHVVNIKLQDSHVHNKGTLVHGNPQNEPLL